MSLLRVQGLTMRFGGLTAVNNVDLEVAKGEITSLIGPNGAGKTTVFNAITGIYEPTKGEVLFEGRPQQRPMTRRTIVGFALIGLLSGLLAAVIAADGDTMWKAAVRSQDTASFSSGRALGEAWRYLNGSLIIDREGGEYQVASQDGNLTFGSVATADEAFRLRDDLMAGNFPPGRDQAFIDRVEAAKAAKANKPWTVLFCGLLGAAVGGAGAFAVWNRSRRTPDVIAMSGIARTFQNIRLFQNMTVMENVLIGMDRSFSGNVGAMALRLPFLCREEMAATKKACELLNFVGIGGRVNDLARNLPYGDQRRLEIARALASGPRLLLLDEPAAGMNPSETVDLMGLIRKIRDRGVTVLLIEHHMSLVMGISDRIAVLDYGVKIAEGTPAEVKANPRVIEAYLGKEEVS